MRDAIAWSHDLLTPDEQTLFRRLGVFSGGFALDAADAVAGAGTSVLDGIASLLDKHLLRNVSGPADEPRFAMLETIREYALERLETSADVALTRRAHAAHYLALAERAYPQLFKSDQAWWLDRLSVEQDNLRAALAWSEASGDTETMLRLTGALLDFWYMRGQLGEGRPWLERALAMPDPNLAAPVQRVRILVGAGQFAHYLGDDASGMNLLRQGLALARESGDLSGIGDATFLLGVIREHSGDYEGAAQLLTEALACFERVPHAVAASLATTHLGLVAYGLGQIERSTDLCQQALGLAETAGDAYTRASALQQLGLIATERGDLGQAATMLAESLALDLANKDPRGIARNLAHLGVVAVACQRPRLAARLLGAAESVRDAAGLRPFPPPAGNAFARATDAARTRLGDEAFGLAWKMGRLRTPDERVADAQEVLDLAGRPLATATRGKRGHDDGLTPREREVLRLLVAGKTDREVAAILFISRKTASDHVGHILAKLRVANRAEAAAAAVRHDLV